MPSIFRSSKKNKPTTTSGPFALTFSSSHKAARVPSSSSLKAESKRQPGPAVGYGGYGNDQEFGALPRQPPNVHTSFPSPPPSPETPTVSTRPARPHTGPGQSHSASASIEDPSAPPPPLPPKFIFLPTYIPHRTGSDNSVDSFKYSSDDVKALASSSLSTGLIEGEEVKYGFLGGVGKGVVLGLEDVKEVVGDVAAELESRGLTTPLLFSTQALEANQARTTLLIQAYLDTLSQRGNNSPTFKSISAGFKNDFRYAKEFELAWLLRWALSRVARRAEGTKEVLRGLMEWEAYEEWRGRERSANYPIDAFPYLSALIPSHAYSVIRPLMHLLSRFVAHSHLSGLTPHTLSSLFAPLLFHIPCNAPALVAHASFVRSAHATEHLLLAYIRFTSTSLSALHASASLVDRKDKSSHFGISDLPPRLKEWVTGYPRMVASDSDLARGHSRQGARLIRCELASRTVRAYSRDLIISSESWADEPDIDPWNAWARVLPPTRPRGEAGRPRYSAGYKQKMRVKGSAPKIGMGPIEYGAGAVMMRQRQGGKKSDGPAKMGRDEEQEGRWGSVAGREWSMFEEGGFGSEVGEKLGFDLTESAKMTVSQKRSTMSWNDFASPSGGFTRTDPGLSSTLTHFSPPISASIAQWPAQRSEMHKRLEGGQKDMVPFQWDTRPRFGPGLGMEEGGRDGTVQVESAFIDFWADLGMGAGWVDRGERTFREANWAFIEYKASPKNAIPHPREDPRTEDLCFLFEERVPPEYQYAIANPAQKRTFNLFSRKKRPPMPPPSHSNSSTRLQSALRSPTGPLGLGLGKSTSRTSATTITPASKGTSSPGHGVPYDHTGKEAEFDRMLMSDTRTKRVQLSKDKEEATIWHKSMDPPLAPLKVSSGSSGTSVPGKSAAALPANRSSVSPVASRTQHIPAPVPTKTASPVGSTPTFKVVSRNRAHTVGQSQAQGQHSRSNQASEEEDEIRTPDMSRDDTSSSPVIVGPGQSPAALPSLGAPIRDVSPGHQAALNAHSALQQLSLAPSASQADLEMIRSAAKKVGKPLPIAPHASARVIQAPAPIDREIRARQESGSDRAEVLAPSPRPPSRDSAGMLEDYAARDTIHGIVDGYNHSERDDDPEEADDGEEEGYDYGDETELDYAHARPEIHDGTRLRPMTDEERERIKFRPVSDIEGEDGEFRPPGPLFDVAPTREPSPGRYMHGLPLHHVAEEEEEYARHR